MLSAPSLSLAERNKPLLTPDELRRLPNDEQIIFIKNLPPIRALKVGYHEIDPWRKQVPPLHGGKLFLGKIKMRMKAGRALATSAGRRMIERVKRPLLLPLFGAASYFRPGRAITLALILFLIIQLFGWPYLLVTQTGPRGGCRHLIVPVITSPIDWRGNWNCPYVLWRK